MKNEIRKIICAGFGGQGVVLLGEMMGFTGVLEDRNYAGHPSYGPEMRSGTCNYKIVLSERNPQKSKISSILPANKNDLDMIVAFTIPAMLKFLSLQHDVEGEIYKSPKLRPEGLCFYNSHMIPKEALPARQDVKLYGIPVTDPVIFGKHAKQSNMIMFGAILEGTKDYDFMKLETVIEKTLPMYLTGEKAKFLQSNIEAINLGVEYFKKNYSK
jgi:2-oxoglutarate ferredoxin oxidoreductase subunit gamma